LQATFSTVERRKRLNWVSTIAFSAFHILAIVALFDFTWPAFWIALATYWISLSFGIGMGYHRLLTHRGYKAQRWFEYTLAICGTLALEGGPISWVATHRIHHQFSDLPGDPHTPNDGKWWSHVLWMIFGDPLHNDATTTARYAPDLARQPFHVWLTEWHWIPLTTLGVLLLAGGWVFASLPTAISIVLWTIFLRVTVGQHVTWAVNSVTHLWGSRRFATRDGSRNNWVVALLSFGEGWHNNHHAHPVSARHGLAWYEFDLTYRTLQLFEKLGVVRNMKVAKIDTVVAAAPAVSQPVELWSSVRAGQA
jgi:stearoyl-CoA desaturase (delta-9 desaturase)